MVRKKQSDIRILVRPGDKNVRKTAKAKKGQEDLGESLDKNDEVKDTRQVVDIGLDISTSIVGLTLLDGTTGQYVLMKAFKLQKAALKDVWDKASFMKVALGDSVDTKKYKVRRIFVEEAAKKFSPGFSSAGTIFALASFNGIVSYIAHELFEKKPQMINVRSARKKLGIKINYKDKSKDTKTKVFDAVRGLNPDFPWEQHTAKTGKKKGQTVYGKQNFDMADAWVICRGGQLMQGSTSGGY